MSFGKQELWAELQEKASEARCDPDFFDQDGPQAQYPGFRGLCAAILAASGNVASWKQQWRTDEELGGLRDRLPRWPSTLEPIDREYGGFFGMTALVSHKGIGKTMLALSSALQAAATQRWNVKFYGAEVDDDEIIDRRNREYLRYPGAVGGNDFFEFRHVGLGQSIEELVFDLIDIDAELPILCVWDSINTIAELMGGDYLRRLSQLAIWAMFARKLSRGAISFLIISETNSKGSSKGQKLEYLSDLCLNMAGKPDETAVDFTIEKNRRGKWIPIPMMTRHWSSNRFYTQDQLQQLESGRMRGTLPTLPEVVDDDENIDLF